ncbi:hypothetical protein [Paenibacillus terrigena]|uniref:hypothetical protein n=1 Tax=Paenibacillus terrigena TaxID=369333 RepID=UPI0028D404CC|nr:hypothetical protein [Paenibacillus terrigena]
MRPPKETPNDNETKPQEMLEALLQKELSQTKDAAEAVGLTERYMKGVTTEQADQMFLLLEGFYGAHLQEAEAQVSRPEVQQKLIKLTLPITLEQASQWKDANLKDLLSSLLKGKYKLESAEGMIFPVVDYEAMKSFQPKVSKPMQDYIALMADDSNRPVARDAGLVIPREELIQRTLHAEKYLTSYPDSPRYDRIKQLYLNKLHMLLFGLNNTPTYDWETFKLQAEVKTELKKLAQDQVSTVTGEMVKEFLAVLEKTKDQLFVKKQGEQKDVAEVRSFMDKMEQGVDTLIRGRTTEG